MGWQDLGVCGGAAARTWVNVLPQDQELGVVLELHQAHLSEGVHLQGAAAASAHLPTWAGRAAPLQGGAGGGS